MNNVQTKAGAAHDQCRVLGQRLRGLPFRNQFYQRPFLAAPMNDELRLRMLFFAVVVCHQTYALKNDRLNLYGWDYLEHGFLAIAAASPELLHPTEISEMAPHALGHRLAPFFSPDATANHSTLDRLEERAQLMIDAADWLCQQHQGNVATFLASTRHRLDGNRDSFYQQLREAKPFADPLRKKSTFLLKLLSDAALYHITDPENLIPVMDYHMQRVLLRTGCVVINDQQLRQNLMQRNPLSSDEAVRRASVEAMTLIAREADLNPLLMNDIFYMLGRSCCLENPMCQSHHCDKNPCSLTLTLALPNHDHCLFTGVCCGETDEEYRKIWHPVVATHFY